MKTWVVRLVDGHSVRLNAEKIELNGGLLFLYQEDEEYAGVFSMGAVHGCWPEKAEQDRTSEGAEEEKDLPAA